MKLKLFFSATAVVAAGFMSAPASAATIIVNGDEWPMSDTGFATAGIPNIQQFVNNIISEFGNTFHAYSQNFGFVGGQLASTMAAAGATYSTGLGITFDLPTLQGYDGIFLGGTYLSAGEKAVLSNYVAGGGNVYIAGGTGFGGPVAEADAWNDFLQPFGIQMQQNYSGPSGTIGVVSSDPLLAGVSQMYFSGTNPIQTGNVICCGPNAPAIAVYRSTVVPPPNVVPLPATGWLMLAGLGGLAIARRRKAG